MGAIGNAISGAVSSAVKGVESFVSNAAQSVVGDATKLFSQAASGFDGLVKGAESAISGLTSGGMPDFGKLASTLLGGLDPSKLFGGVEKFIQGLISKADPQTLENGQQVATGGAQARGDMSAEVAALMEQIKALIASKGGGATGAGSTTGTGSSTGAATGTGSTSTSGTSSTGASGGRSFEDIMSQANAGQNYNSNGLSSAQQKAIDQIQDPAMKAQQTAMAQLQNMQQQATFAADANKLHNDTIMAILAKM